jgi:hypothetical protein
VTEGRGGLGRADLLLAHREAAGMRQRPNVDSRLADLRRWLRDADVFERHAAESRRIAEA